MSTHNSTSGARQVLQAPQPNPSLSATADHKLKTGEAPVYAPGPGEVLLHVKATGICGSDVHFWKTGAIGSLVFEGDCILGHEAAGVVVRCGEGVTGLSPGDRVAVEPGVPCERCFLCRMGRYNLCEDVAFAGVYPYDGSLQRYKVHPARWLHKYVIYMASRFNPMCIFSFARHHDDREGGRQADKKDQSTGYRRI
jgi:L-iditol 2-dehydrogenase